MAFSDKQAAFNYINEYQKEKYDRITVMAKKGKKAEYEEAAKARGMKLSAFMQYCADKELGRKAE
ncbi:hypothetical protein [Enterocloster lavalensis]|uniref:hypothetical protein n=1 Tax=Enterocloster lavalensis TaxID=460384 RepID=UPI000D1AE6FF|nr:hypothetical protein [Enterocloster lavalensis]PST30030.1 hypothetical protein C7256_26730 [Enterocloster lavalensis]